MGADGPRVAVVGGSLGGLLTALVLRDTGCDVQVFERSATPLEGRGAGIVLHPITVRYLQASGSLDLAQIAAASRTLRYLTAGGDLLLERSVRYLFTSYAALYGSLVERLEAERYHLGSECVGLEPDEDRVLVRFANGRRIPFDLVVGADGIRSTVRGLLFSDIAPVYAGYVGWRGTLPEDELSSRARRALLGALSYFVGAHTHVLSYPIPSERRDQHPSRDDTLDRLINWVWYRNVPVDELDDLLTDPQGVHHDLALSPGAVRASHVAEIRAAARHELPPPFADLVESTKDPFVQVIVDIGVPRMAVGRVCLIGDAAFTLRPHVAAGTAKAAADAHALAEAVSAADGDVLVALRRWEPGQREMGASALARSRAIGRAVQEAGTYRPGDPSVAFGLASPGDSNFSRL